MTGTQPTMQGQSPNHSNGRALAVAADMLCSLATCACPDGAGVEIPRHAQPLLTAMAQPGFALTTHVCRTVHETEADRVCGETAVAFQCQYL